MSVSDTKATSPDDGTLTPGEQEEAAPPEPRRRPRFGLLALEARAVLELAALAPAYPFLRRAPRGDGHPVLVLPGFTGGDFSTGALRAFLRDRGYAAYGWKLGRNLGPTPEVIRGIAVRLDQLRKRHGRKVSLIGWSLGGIFARELARRFPHDVRLVITLASPFRDILATNVPTAMRQRRNLTLPAEVFQQYLRAPIPVPMTAIFSKTDGIASWKGCMADPGPMTENIEVESSHLGIGHHPVVLLTIADRLAQPEGEWKPFEPPKGWRWPLVPRVWHGTLP
jgi:hypothetical protein